jgi:cyclophilin family peptidyl-prolyl cis-trans isomerase/HEAT repeat protein
MGIGAGCSGIEAGPDFPVPEDVLAFRDIEPDPAAFVAILEAEDRRASRPGDLDLLTGSLASPHPGIRRAAARALGRLERSEVMDALLPTLLDPDPSVRVEGANALAQGVRFGEVREVARVREALSAAMEAADGAVLGALARSAGRLPLLEEQDLFRGEAALLAALAAPAGESGPATLGVARGALFLYRNASGSGGVEASGELMRQIEALSREGADAAVRLAAAQARRAAGAVQLELAQAWLADPHPELRREGAGALPGSGMEEVTHALRAAMEDPVDRVRVEGVRSHARLRREGNGCGPLVEAVGDPSDHVGLAALDALAGSPQAGACPADDRLTELMEELVRSLPPGGEEGWHRPTGAMMVLARIDADRARVHLPSFMAHPHPFVRAHAARIAGILGERDLLTLAEDPAPNVREAALQALTGLPGGAPLPVLHAQLLLDDPMLLRTTGLLLEGRSGSRPRGGPTREEVVERLLEALGRTTSARAITTRDARVPLLRRIGEWGNPADAPRLAPYLQDFDPVLAGEAAAILERWTGSPVEPTPDPLPAAPLPSIDRLREMETGRVEVEMAGGGRFLLRLLPFEAPTNAARFVAMAERGDFDGLTLHRVVANFVVQGGSPGANEYAGHGAYTRDELGLPGHWRGTAGISTRGRDTGDGQIFINLVGNLRLDHDYTVFAVVVEGMETVDGIQEGDRVAAVRYRATP